MAKYVDDNVLHNILARLPGKQLLRLRSASKRWNRLISDPYFMKSRSRRMILLPFARPLVVVDDNLPPEEEDNMMMKAQSPLEYQQEGTQASVVGTFDGVVLLFLTNCELLCCKLILYNPLTGASKLIMDCDYLYMFKFGFGYGETKHDLKIVRFKLIRGAINQQRWDVFDLKTSLWSTQPQYLEPGTFFWGDVGVFINGFLYWGIDDRLLALNVKEMVFSKIELPVDILRLMGSTDGCLCVMKRVKVTTFHLWLMKDDDRSWTKARSFTFDLCLGNEWYHRFRPVCILGNGNILMANGLVQFAIYDTSTDSHKTLNNLDDANVEWRDYIFPIDDNRAIEYVESLVSPSDMCGGI